MLGMFIYLIIKVYNGAYKPAEDDQEETPSLPPSESYGEITASNTKPYPTSMPDPFTVPVTHVVVARRNGTKKIIDNRHTTDDYITIPENTAHAFRPTSDATTWHANEEDN